MDAQELQAIRNLIAHVEKTGSIEKLLRAYREQTPKLLDEIERLSGFFDGLQRKIRHDLAVTDAAIASLRGDDE